jgi:hypothetical protein
MMGGIRSTPAHKCRPDNLIENQFLREMRGCERTNLFGLALILMLTLFNCVMSVTYTPDLEKIQKAAGRT